MKSMRSLIVIAAALLVATSAVAADKPTLTESIERLESVADTYPPRVDDKNRQEILDLWKSVEAGMQEYRSAHSSPDENTEFLLGEIYRLGHNLDVDGASERATSHFRAAIAINPASSRAHLLLGRHLTFINDLPAGQQELLLGIALDPRGANDRALFDLTYNFYLQKQFAMASSTADRYLRMHPDDPAIKLLSEVSKRTLAGGAPPKTITIEKP